MQHASPFRRPCSIASRWRRSGIASRSPPSPDRGACTLWFARTAQGAVESWPAHELTRTWSHSSVQNARTHTVTRVGHWSPSMRMQFSCCSDYLPVSHILWSRPLYCAGTRIAYLSGEVELRFRNPECTVLSPLYPLLSRSRDHIRRLQDVQRTWIRVTSAAAGIRSLVGACHNHHCAYPWRWLP